MRHKSKDKRLKRTEIQGQNVREKNSAGALKCSSSTSSYNIAYMSARTELQGQNVREKDSADLWCIKIVLLHILIYYGIHECKDRNARTKCKRKGQC
jgi:hypothetical protein